MMMLRFPVVVQGRTHWAQAAEPLNVRPARERLVLAAIDGDLGWAADSLTSVGRSLVVALVQSTAATGSRHDHSEALTSVKGSSRSAGADLKRVRVRALRGFNPTATAICQPKRRVNRGWLTQQSRGLRVPRTGP